MFKTIEQKFHRKEVIQIINPKEDLTGKRFGRWTVLQQSEDHISPSGKHRTTWLCQCDCGTIREVMQIGLKDGTSQSCGCLSKEMTSKRSKKMFYKRNSYDLSGDYGIGYTCNGEFYFDLEDYDKIKDYCWYINWYGYVTSIDKNTNKRVQMHRLIMNITDKNLDVDHKNGSNTKNDNRKYNLRVATRSQNNMNKEKMKTNTSGVVGVGWHKSNSKWRAYIKKDNKQIDLGYFDNFNDAVKAIKEAEEKFFGKWSYSNSREVL